MGDSDRALSAYENALRHNPHSLDALTQVAGIARIRENNSKVRTVLFRCYDVPIRCGFFIFTASVLLFRSEMVLPFMVGREPEFDFHFIFFFNLQSNSIRFILYFICGTRWVCGSRSWDLLGHAFDPPIGASISIYAASNPGDPSLLLVSCVCVCARLELGLGSRPFPDRFSFRLPLLSIFGPAPFVIQPC